MKIFKMNPEQFEKFLSTGELPPEMTAELNALVRPPLNIDRSDIESGGVNMAEAAAIALSAYSKDDEAGAANMARELKLDLLAAGPSGLDATLARYLKTVFCVGYATALRDAAKGDVNPAEVLTTPTPPPARPTAPATHRDTMKRSKR